MHYREQQPPLTVPRLHTVKRIGRTWAVVGPSGNTIEGGFFGRMAAERNAEQRDREWYAAQRGAGSSIGED